MASVTSVTCIAKTVLAGASPELLAHIHLDVGNLASAEEFIINHRRSLDFVDLFPGASAEALVDAFTNNGYHTAKGNALETCLGQRGVYGLHFHR